MTRYILPPLSPLRAFEAAARRASFKAAAAELFVTPTAISHQIRQLETWLGVRVLDRTPRAVTLTPEGLLLYRATVLGFGEIGRVAAQLRDGLSAKALTLSTTTAFLSHWLVPRLDALRGLLPDLDLRLHASQAVVDLAPGGVEVAIRYGAGLFAGVESTWLKDDLFAPVCSPLLKMRGPADLRRAALIHVDGRTAQQPAPGWRAWCERAGIAGVDTDAGVRFNDSQHAVQAAVAGGGIALVSLVLVADALASGLLVQPFAVTLPGAAYHFACAPGLGERPDVVALRGWFQQALSAA